MLTLIPTWAQHYDEYWAAIRRRNLWFIKLRYFAVVALLGFLLGGQFILDFQFTQTQITAILLIDLIILFYNVLIHWYRQYISISPTKFNAMHLSLIQMLLDLISLIFLVYYTGTVHSPLYMFFVFQFVIGSLILLGYLVYTIAVILIIVYSTMVFLQHYGLIKSHIISGLYFNTPDAHNLTYLILFLLVFSTMMLITVYLTNTIARTLYKREQQLRETLNQLNEAEMQKQKYIMGVVHEIKTPIAAVQSFLDLIIQNFLGPVSEQVEDKVKKAKKRTEEAIEMINDILRISKLKMLNITEMEEIDITESIQSIMDKVSETALSKKVDIKFNDNRVSNNLIKADKVLIELALSNVINNAIKYNLENGKVEVTLTDKDTNLIIEICDDGLGIPKNEQQSVFLQFYRASNIKRGKHEGSGLGLSLVKEIIERHNGKIEIQSPSRLASQNRPGTSFIISLPMTDKKIRKRRKIKNISEI